MNLIEAIQPLLPTSTAIVGAGGKTTALFQLAHQIENPVWVMTTTHLGTDQIDLADRHFTILSINEIDINQLTKQKISLITGSHTSDDRVSGLTLEVLESLRQLANQEKISILIEADGSRSFPLKAPAEHEPAIPNWVKYVVVVVGLSVLGQPLSSKWVHRYKEYSCITKLKENEPVTIESICNMLIHAEGGLKNIPPNAQKVVLFNQADTQDSQIQARKVVQKLLTNGYQKIIVGSLSKDPQRLECYPAP